MVSLVLLLVHAAMQSNLRDRVHHFYEFVELFDKAFIIRGWSSSI
jgi:hypothetical protein